MNKEEILDSVWSIYKAICIGYATGHWIGLLIVHMFMEK